MAAALGVTRKTSFGIERLRRGVIVFGGEDIAAIEHTETAIGPRPP